jgi:hypothetical protein
MASGNSTTAVTLHVNVESSGFIFTLLYVPSFFST